MFGLDFLRILHVDCSQAMSWLSVSIWLPNQRKTFSKKLHKPLLKHYLWYLINYTNILRWCHIFTFLKIKKCLICQKCLFSSIFNDKINTQKHTNSDKVLFQMCLHLTAVMTGIKSHLSQWIHLKLNAFNVI